MPRLLAIGDVHGCLTALDTLLGFVAPKPTDQLIFLGDYVDRGPDSNGVLNRLIKLRLDGKTVCLRGNHEVMMCAASERFDSQQFWLSCGGHQTLESYDLSPNQIAEIPDPHWHFIERTCVDWYETPSFIFVHAGLHPDTPVAEQLTDWLHWQFLDPAWFRPHCSGKTMICGHSEQRNGRPLVIPGAVCVDTWAYGDGKLTCLDVESGDYWQADEYGRTFTGHL